MVPNTVIAAGAAVGSYKLCEYVKPEQYVPVESPMMRGGAVAVAGAAVTYVGWKKMDGAAGAAVAGAGVGVAAYGLFRAFGI